MGGAWRLMWGYESPGTLYRAQAPLDRIQTMARSLTADDITPLVASLPDSERIRLLRWMSPHGAGAAAYRVAPPTDDEFPGDEEPLAWEADGWEEFH
jgi:hypothetical protein